MKVPCAEFEDLPIQIRNILVPCDFVVLDMAEDPHTPVILARDALKTLGALIECEAEIIIFRVAQKKVVFAFSKSYQEPMFEQVFSYEVVEE